MFREWGFLITEMVVLIALAALLGLLVGWLIWGRRGEEEFAVSVEELESDRLKGELAKCREEAAQREAEIATLQGALDTARGNAAPVVAELAPQPAANPAPEPAPQPAAPAQDYDKDGVVEGTDEGVKPATLSAARDGQADDLKQIKGIGPKLEQLCNRLGFYHFDQIAAWSADEVAWVDANLEGFKGRVSRDKWVEQATLLAAGGETEFSKRVEDGDVY